MHELKVSNYCYFLGKHTSCQHKIGLDEINLQFQRFDVVMLMCICENIINVRFFNINYSCHCRHHCIGLYTQSNHQRGIKP